MAEVQIQSMRPKHHAIIDRLIIDPTIKMSHLAAEIGVTPAWLSVVMNSDVFREEYIQRRMEHNSGLSSVIVQRQLEIALKALNKLDLVLDSDDVEDRLVLDAAEKTTRMLGFSPSAGNAPNLHRNVETEERTREVIREVAPGVVERARETIRKYRSTEPFNALPSTEG